MRNKIGTLCMILGAALVFGALFLFIHNQQENDQAKAASLELMTQLVAKIEVENAANSPEDNDAFLLEGLEIPEQLQDPESFVMPEVVINSYAYIGYLSIPDLGLELPIMADWDYTRLQIAPCRYTGTVKGENLVLMAHNYASHFGYISSLTPGADVYFTNMDGKTTQYEVVALDVLAPTAVEEMTAGVFDLTLFTCTYGGQSRVTVYCDMAN